MQKRNKMKEYNYISALDGFLRAKIYLWMINVILYVRSFRVAEIFLLAGILLMGVSISVSYTHLTLPTKA